MAARKNPKQSKEHAEKSRENGRKSKKPREIGFIFDGRYLQPGERISDEELEKHFLKDINFNDVKMYLQVQAPAEEIADNYSISVDSLSRRLKEHVGMGFAELKQKYSATGKLALRIRLWTQSKNNFKASQNLAQEWIGHNSTTNLNVTQKVEMIQKAILELEDNGFRTPNNPN